MQASELDTATHCTRCKTPFANFDGARIGISVNDADAGLKLTEVICPACDFGERIYAYRKTGEMGSRLVTEAVMARIYLLEGFPDRFRATTRASWEANRFALLEIAEKNDRISARARVLEETIWLGPDKLQGYYAASKTRGHKGQTNSYKAMLWGSAGRVLLTLQDIHPQGHLLSRFGGAWLTLIFDETATTCRGGIQGYCATYEEAIGLLNAALAGFPILEPDGDVTVAGL